MNLSPNSETPDKITPNLLKPSDAAPGLAHPDAAPSAMGAPQAAGSRGSARPLKVRKRGQVWKVLGLAVLAGGGASAAYLTQTTHGRKLVVITTGLLPSIRPVLEARQNPELIFDQDKSDVVNILLVGRDQNYRQVYRNGINVAHEVDPTTPARSDSMIIVSMDRVKKTIRMVSLPRDVMVHLPPNKYHVRLAKLNAAHSYGGVELLKQTLHDELGITIQHYAVIKFDGFMKMVDEVGGVNVNVLGALHRDGTRRNLIYNDSWAIPPLHIDLKPGWQTLHGKEAHAYVRFRMDLEGDTGRIRRQQSLMRALATKLKQLPVTEIPGIMAMIREQFETDMDISQLASTGFFAKGLGETSRMQPVTLYGTYTERGQAKLNRKRNKALLHAIFGPTFNAENFMQHSPTVNDYEFGPDDTKPDTRELLREAGLLEGEPRVAASNQISPDDQPPSALAPGGFASPLSSAPGTGSDSASLAPSTSPTARDPFSYTSPETPGSQPADADRSPAQSPSTDSSAQGASSGESLRAEPSSRSEVRPRRRSRSRASREASRAERRGERSSAGASTSTSSRRRRREEQAASASSGAEQSPIPRPEADSPSSGLSVESPLPRAEN